MASLRVHAKAAWRVVWPPLACVAVLVWCISTVYVATGCERHGGGYNLTSEEFESGCPRALEMGVVGFWVGVLAVLVIVALVSFAVAVWRAYRAEVERVLREEGSR